MDAETDNPLGPTSGSIVGKPGIVRMMNILAGLKAAGKTDLNASLARWFLADPAERTLSPLSKVRAPGSKPR